MDKYIEMERMNQRVSDQKKVIEELESRECSIYYDIWDDDIELEREYLLELQIQAEDFEDTYINKYNI